MNEPTAVMFGPKQKRLPEGTLDDSSLAKRARIVPSARPSPPLVSDNYLEIALQLYHKARDDEEFYITLVSLLLAWKTSKEPEFQRLAKEARKLLRSVVGHVDLGAAYARAYFTHSVAVAANHDDHLYFRNFFRERLLHVAPGWLVIYDRAESIGLFKLRYEEEQWPCIAPRWKDPCAYDVIRTMFRDGTHSRTRTLLGGVLDTDLYWEMKLAHRNESYDSSIAFPRIKEPFRILLAAFTASKEDAMDGMPNVPQAMRPFHATEYGVDESDVDDEVDDIEMEQETRVRSNAHIRPFWDFIVTACVAEPTPDGAAFLASVLSSLVTRYIVRYHEAVKQLVKSMIRNASAWIARAEHFALLIETLHGIDLPYEEEVLMRHCRIGEAARLLLASHNPSGLDDVLDVLFKQILKNTTTSSSWALSSIEQAATRRWDSNPAAKRLTHHEIYLLYLCYCHDLDRPFFAHLEQSLRETHVQTDLKDIWDAPFRTDHVHPYWMLFQPTMATKPDRMERLLTFLEHVFSGFVSTTARHHRPGLTGLANDRRKFKMRIPYEFEQRVARFIGFPLNEDNEVNIVTIGVTVDRILRDAWTLNDASNLSFQSAVAISKAVFQSELISVKKRDEFLPLVEATWSMTREYIAQKEYTFGHPPNPPVPRDFFTPPGGGSIRVSQLWNYVVPNFLSPTHAAAYLTHATLRRADRHWVDHIWESHHPLTLLALTGHASTLRNLKYDIHHWRSLRTLIRDGEAETRKMLLYQLAVKTALDMEPLDMNELSVALLLEGSYAMNIVTRLHVDKALIQSLAAELRQRREERD